MVENVFILGGEVEDVVLAAPHEERILAAARRILLAWYRGGRRACSKPLGKVLILGVEMEEAQVLSGKGNV